MKAAGTLLLTFFAATALAQTNITAISNVGQASFENPPVGYTVAGSFTANEGLAVSFITGSTPCYFSTASILMGSASGGGTFALSLSSNNGGVPGNTLVCLSGNTNPTKAGVYTYTNESSLELAPNTTYWLVATNSGGSGVYSWCATQSTNLDAGSIWTLGALDNYTVAYNNGTLATDTGWELYPLQAYVQFSIGINNPQVPAISISQAVVLTYPVTGFQYVLQQNCNLAAANWNNVTNAILSGVISNQTVFIVPGGGSQMFYRLNPVQ